MPMKLKTITKSVRTMITFDTVARRAGLTTSNAEADDAIPIAECGMRIAEWETYAPFSAWVDLGWVDLCLVPG
jgi:hypothetical protein